MKRVGGDWAGRGRSRANEARERHSHPSLTTTSWTPSLTPAQSARAQQERAADHELREESRLGDRDVGGIVGIGRLGQLVPVRRPIAIGIQAAVVETCCGLRVERLEPVVDQVGVGPRPGRTCGRIGISPDRPTVTKTSHDRRLTSMIVNRSG